MQVGPQQPIRPDERIRLPHREPHVRDVQLPDCLPSQKSSSVGSLDTAAPSPSWPCGAVIAVIAVRGPPSAPPQRKPAPNPPASPGNRDRACHAMIADRGAALVPPCAAPDSILEQRSRGAPPPRVAALPAGGREAGAAAGTLAEARSGAGRRAKGPVKSVPLAAERQAPLRWLCLHRPESAASEGNNATSPCHREGRWCPRKARGVLIEMTSVASDAAAGVRLG